ncbi:hypothetical protein SynBIOSE41_01518 [Synechococcus sp. BIOS-E4-1]|nr:hypothetical protein SynBIOSE41_01518 [Synechococcus sp. BIOS-E4-1]
MISSNHWTATSAEASFLVAAQQLVFFKFKTIASAGPPAMKRQMQTKNRPRHGAVHPSSPAIPITRLFAPHLVALGENGNARTTYVELLKTPFRIA